MITASLLRAGMAVRFEGQPYKALAAEYHPGQGKMGGVTQARLRNPAAGTQWRRGAPRYRYHEVYGPGQERRQELIL